MGEKEKKIINKILAFTSTINVKRLKYTLLISK